MTFQPMCPPSGGVVCWADVSVYKAKGRGMF